MKALIQLSETGKQRLQEALLMAEKGDFTAEPSYYRNNTMPQYFEVRVGAVYTCCFVPKLDMVKDDLIKQLNTTLSAELRMRNYSDYQPTGRLITGAGVQTVPLNRSDYTTPAQRALERLGERINS